MSTYEDDASMGYTVQPRPTLLRGSSLQAEVQRLEDESLAQNPDRQLLQQQLIDRSQEIDRNFSIAEQLFERHK